MVLPLAIGLMGNLAVVLFVLTCLALILIVLLQKGRGGGLSAAFGGGGAGSLLGTKTGDVLTWITICLVAFFLVLSILMGKFLPKGAVSSDLNMPISPTETTSETIPSETITPQTGVDVVEGATDVVESTVEVVEDAAKAVAEEAEEAAAEVESMIESVTEAVNEQPAN